MEVKAAFSCQYCDKSFTRKFTLDNHIESLHEKKGYLCDICKVRICRKRPHSCAVQHGVCECFVCGLRFSSSKAMFRHRNLAHPVDMSAISTDESQTDVVYIPEPKRPTKHVVLPSIDSLLEKTLFTEEQTNEEEIDFEDHPALRHFQLKENTVVTCDDIVYLKCPLCFEVYNSFDSFKEHIECYNFIPAERKSEFYDSIAEIIADMTTIYFTPSNCDYIELQ